MSNKRNEYIDQLLSDLKLLEQRLLSVKESDTLPFSFFSASFDRIEKISRSLHELELMQIGEMKEQMERLVKVLSESETMKSPIDQPEQPKGSEAQMELPEQPVQADQAENSDNRVEQSKQPERPEEYMDQPEEPELPESFSSPETPSPEAGEIFIEEKKVTFTERIILPEYRDPRVSEGIPPTPGTGNVLSEKNGQEKQVTRSLNDTIQAPPVLLDLKRGISLNDRFLFQRELFNNSRAEMDSVMEALNTLAGFEEVENYLKRERNWNFEDRTVKEFLLIIKKGFE